MDEKFAERKSGSQKFWNQGHCYSEESNTQKAQLKKRVMKNNGDDLGDEFMQIYDKPSVTELQMTFLWNNLTKETL